MQVVVLAFALSADAAAATAAISALGIRLGRQLLWLSLACGVAQGGMAALGAFGGQVLVSSFSTWAGYLDYLAALVLAVLGVRAWLQATQPPPPLGVHGIAGLALATSIDALAGGVALPAMGVPVGVSVAVIAGITAGCCGLAGWVAARVGARFGPPVARLGAVVLLALGAWIAGPG